MPEFKDDERDFIEASLSGRDGVELQETDEEIIVIKKKKVKKTKSKKKDRLPILIGVFFILPFILTGVFMISLFRIESFVGGKSALEWLSAQEIDSEFQQTASASGFSWLPQFLEIYSNRGLIIAITFTISFLIACALIAYDATKRKNLESDGSESENENE